MKRFISTGVLVVALGACGGGSSQGDATDTTDTGAMTTTSAPTGGADCTSEAASTGVGVDVSLYEPCVDGWATAQETAYVADCVDCESVLLLHLVDNTWRLAFNCNQYVALDEGCVVPTPASGTDLNIESGATLPPIEIACKIWDYYSWPENIVSGGCFGKPTALRYDEIPRCDLPLSKEGDFPIIICRKGDIIRSVQAALRKLGHSLSVDGEFGPGTLKAVIAYQMKNKMPVTGAIDFVLLVNLGIADPSEGDY